MAPDPVVHLADGSHRLTKSAGSIGTVDQSNEVVIPVVAEELTVEKEQIVRGKVRPELIRHLTNHDFRFSRG